MTDAREPIEVAVARLGELGQVDFWQGRQRRRGRRLRRSLVQQQFRSRVGSARADAGVVASFARRAAWPALTAVLLVAVSELIAWALGRAGWSFVDRADHRLTAGSYETLAGTAVTAEAAFLALFYTTVGVVASTAYQAVPGEIRQLFVEERAGSVYTRGVVRALVFGVIILLAGSIGYRPYALSVIVLAGLAITAIVRLMILGTDLFNFFDPATLSTPLPGRFARALALATTPATTLDEASQHVAHQDAAATLQLYRRIAVLLAQRPAHDAAAPTRVAIQVAGILAAYSGKKNTIPTASHWWNRIPTHPNWLTLDHTRLQMALTTATGVQPELAPDALWVERDAAAILELLLSALNREEQPAAAIQCVDAITPLVRHLASQLQVNEALIVQGSLADNMTSAANSSAGLNQMAAAERCTLTLTQVWLGYAVATESVGSQDVAALLDQGLASSAALYRTPLPRPALDLLDRFTRNIDLEVHAEGRRITPAWWVHHYGARALSQHLVDAHDAIITEIEPRALAPVQDTIAAGRHEQAAIMIFAGLELVEKIEAHQPGIAAALDALGRLRRENTGDATWPEPPDDTLMIQQSRDRLMRQLALCLPNLRNTVHDPARPDLFGQAYQFLFDTTFDAILDGGAELARDLFPIVFAEASPARDRLLSDLAGQQLREQFVYSTEPFMGLMELSGYALLMQELDGHGIWDDVRAVWDRVLSPGANPNLPTFLLGITTGLESIFALTQSGIARTARRQRLNRRFEDRGIHDTDDDWSPLSRPRRSTAPHRSAVVSAFAPGYLGIHDDLHDLFLAEYLAARLPAGTTLSKHTQSLADRISRFRDDAATRDTNSGGGETDDGHDSGGKEPEAGGGTDEIG